MELNDHHNELVNIIQEIHEKYFVGVDLAEGMYILAELTAAVMGNAPEDSRKRGVIELYKLVKKAMDLD